MHEKQIIKHLCGDILLRPLVERIEFPLIQPSPDPLEYDLIKAIIYQQLSTKAATTIYNRFLDLFPDRIIQTEQLLSFSESDLRSVGVSRQKSRYIHHIAEFFQQEANRDRLWQSLEDVTLLKDLTSIKGVGTWTVKMVMISNLGKRDVFAPEDLGIQIAMKELYELKEEKRDLQNAMTMIAEAWRPYRTYACHYLWRWKDGA